MKKIGNLMAEIEEGKYSALEIIMASLILFLFGLVMGIFLSPRKDVMIGSNNSGNGCNNSSSDDWEDWEIEDEDLD